MTKIKAVLPEWIYKLKNYLEETIAITSDGGSLQIEQVAALANVAPLTYQVNLSLCRQLTGKIAGRLRASGL